MKDYSQISILIFGAGGRQALPMCKGFYSLGCKVTVYCHHKTDTGYLTRFSTSRILYDDKNGTSFLEYGLSIIKKGKFDLVVPLGDKTALFLSEHKKELSPFAKIAVNDWDVFQNVIDKMNTMRICEENSIPAPKTVFSTDPVNEIKKLGIQYPVVVKPKTGVGSIGFNIIKNEDTLIKLLNEYDNSNGPLLVQEYIEQGGAHQFGVDMFRDRDGMIRSAVVLEKTRWYPLDGGSTVFAISIHNEEIVDICSRLLGIINWNGFADIDLVWDAKSRQMKILEINGRVGARVMLDFISGIDVAKLILENELGYPVTDMINYQNGKMITCLLPDLLWFLKSPDRFKTKPSWFHRWGVKDVIFSWDDPLPSVGFLFESIKGYRNAMKKRQRIEQ